MDRAADPGTSGSAAKPRSVPVRTCVGCGRKAAPSDLLRLARAEGGRLGLWAGAGRSAYICPNPECVRAAFAKGRIERTLHGPVEAGSKDLLREALLSQLR